MAVTFVLTLLASRIGGMVGGLRALHQAFELIKFAGGKILQAKTHVELGWYKILQLRIGHTGMVAGVNWIVSAELGAVAEPHSANHLF